MNLRHYLKWLGIAAGTIVVLFLAYQILLIFPQPFFPYHAQYKHIKIYSRNKLSANITEMLQKTDNLLSRSELYNPEKESRIFVCDSYKVFWFYTGGQRHIFAVCYPHTSGNIFVPKADYERDLVLFEKINPQDTRQRHLTNTLAHEITHFYIYDYLGARAEAALPGWIKEGYCEYVGKGDALDAKEGIHHLLNGDQAVLGLYYFRSRRMMELLIDSQGLSIKEILSHPPNEADISNKLLETIKSHQN